ncbi:MAG TPA: hypothetical protein VKA51_04085 [Rubrobacteraceae bacterium]|nr:hypothetical protein [Rubrobacteraceae bacterium]
MLHHEPVLLDLARHELDGLPPLVVRAAIHRPVGLPEIPHRQRETGETGEAAFRISGSPRVSASVRRKSAPKPDVAKRASTRYVGMKQYRTSSMSYSGA